MSERFWGYSCRLQMCGRHRVHDQPFLSLPPPAPAHTRWSARLWMSNCVSPSPSCCCRCHRERGREAKRVTQRSLTPPLPKAFIFPSHPRHHNAGFWEAVRCCGHISSEFLKINRWVWLIWPGSALPFPKQGHVFLPAAFLVPISPNYWSRNKVVYRALLTPWQDVRGWVRKRMALELYFKKFSNMFNV